MSAAALRNLGRLPIAARLTGKAPAQVPKGTRGFAAEEGKVDYPWNAPGDPGKWKSEHVVFVVLAGWGVVIGGAMKAFK